MNILLLASHAVAEYDDVRMFTDLGYDIFAPGGYEVPGSEGEGIRPTLPHSPAHPDLVARLHETRHRHRDDDPSFAIDWGKADLHPDIIDWADVVIAHHYLDRWIVPQYPKFAGKRVIWRTCGQSSEPLERMMKRLPGLEIVRYSPAERRYFEGVGAFAGEDAIIRFGKYPSDFEPWIGDNAVVGNVTQDMVGRGDATGLAFWQAATEGLPVSPAGESSERIGGVGRLTYPEMLDYLRHLRGYLYTGTTPASYTLGLIEAMMAGVPVVSIGPKAWGGPHYAPLFEGHEIVGEGYDDAGQAHLALRGMVAAKRPHLLDNQRQRAIDLFGIETIGAQWLAFLGSPASAVLSTERETVTA